MALGPLFGMPAALLGARIIERRRANGLGWILLAMGLAQTIAQTSNAYAALSIDHAGHRHRAGDPVAMQLRVDAGGGARPVPAAVSRRAAARTTLAPSRLRPGAALLAAIVVASAVLAWPVRGTALYRSMVASTTGIAPVHALPTTALFLIGEALLVVGAVGLLLRLRRLPGRRTAANQVVRLRRHPVGGGRPGLQIPPAVRRWAGLLISLSGLLGAITVAVFRYQLYDIGRLLNRTLVYALLTAILGTGYAALVLVFGRLLGRDRSSLGVAGATLAAADCSNRCGAASSRGWTGADRRRYDAAQTIERFSTRLRQEVDLDALTSELLAVVDQTMQPTAVSLWLRHPAGQRAGNAATGRRRWWCRAAGRWRSWRRSALLVVAGVLVLAPWWRWPAPGRWEPPAGGAGPSGRRRCVGEARWRRPAGRPASSRCACGPLIGCSKALPQLVQVPQMAAVTAPHTSTPGRCPLPWPPVRVGSVWNSASNARP